MKFHDQRAFSHNTPQHYNQGIREQPSHNEEHTNHLTQEQPLQRKAAHTNS